MSSASAHAAVPSTSKRKVVSREVLWEGIVEAAIPLHAEPKVAEDTPDGRIAYLQYSYSLVGGRLNVHRNVGIEKAPGEVEGIEHVQCIGVRVVAIVT